MVEVNQRLLEGKCHYHGFPTRQRLAAPFSAAE